jgi:hypothetical protein
MCLDILITSLYFQYRKFLRPHLAIGLSLSPIYSYDNNSIDFSKDVDCIIYDKHILIQSLLAVDEKVPK